MEGLTKAKAYKIRYKLFFVCSFIVAPVVFLTANSSKNNIKESNPFIENKGQLRFSNSQSCDKVFYYTEKGNLRSFIRETGVSYVISKSDIKITGPDFDPQKTKNTHSGCRIDIDFVGANKNATLTGIDVSISNRIYFQGPDEKATFNVKAFGKIVCENLYDNINALYMGTIDGGMKYDLVVKPQGNVSNIKLKYTGQEKILLHNNKLEVYGGGELLREYIPKIYQLNGEQQIEIKGCYLLHGDEISFLIEDYDKTKELIIDPWVTYWGGNDRDDCTSVATDLDGNAIVTGYTASTNFPVTPGAFKSTLSSYDAFVSKFTDGGILVWSTFLGGTGDDFGRAITVDASNRIIVSGSTSSANFPIVGIASQPVKAGAYDVFVLLMDGAGNPTLSTFYGGNDDEAPNRITVDPSGNILFSGYTMSTNIPGTAGAFQTQNKLSSFMNYGDAFVTKMNSSCVVQWATYFGGAEDDYSVSLITDSNGNIFFTGATNSVDFPVTSGSMQTIFANGHAPGTGADGFLVKLSPSGALQFSTYWGDGNHDTGTGLVVDKNNNVILNGFTWSSGMPVTPGAYQTAHGGGSLDGFVSKFNNNGNIIWSTFYGNSGNETGAGIVIDKYDNVTVASSGDGGLPTSSCSYQANYGGGGDCFVLRLDKNGNYLCSTYLGGGSYERDGKLCLYKENLYIVGYNYMGGLPTTAGAAQSSYGGGILDGYIARICNLTCGYNALTINFNSNKTNICSGDNINYSSTVTLSCDTSEIEWYWEFPGGTPSTSTARNPQGIIYSSAGTYNVKLKINSPCVDDSLVQTALISVTTTPTALITGSTSICSGTSTTLSSTSASAYQWNTGATTSTINVSPTMQTIYTLTVSNGICNANTTTTVIVNPQPAALISGTASICTGNSTVLTASGGVNYNWNTGSSTSTLTVNPTSNSIYSVTVSNGSCRDVAIFSLTVNTSPTILFSGITSICSGDSTTLSASGAANYAWSNGSSTSSIVVQPASPTSYTVIGASANNCSSTSIITVSVTNMPIANAGVDTTICYGSSALLNASGGNNFSWNTGATSTSITVTPPLASIYSVTVANGNCIDYDDVQVNVVPSPTIIARGDITAVSGTVVTLSASGSGTTYSWSPSAGLSCVTCQNPTLIVTQSMIYYVTTINDNGCTSTDTVIVTLDETCGQIYIPNVFSPNEDGQNDLFSVYGTAYNDFELKIYNRWGQLMTVLSDDAQSWDGNFKGKELEPDVFIYILNAFCKTTGEELSKSGTISLVK